MPEQRKRLLRARYQWGRILRHLQWLRAEGPARLIEEDNLDLASRLRLRRARARWRREHPEYAGRATPVFVVGLQRSGTNMLIRGFDHAPEFEIYNENDNRAFDRFRLRDDATVKRIATSSHHQFVLFKPLCDSHRVRELLELNHPQPANAVWIYRAVDGRSRSAVAKFGEAGLRAIREIGAGRTQDMWQAGGLTSDDVDLVHSLNPDTLDAINGAAMLWYLRNNLYFKLGLDQDPRIYLTSYEAFISDPEVTMKKLCSQIGVPYRPSFVAHVEPGRVSDTLADLHPRVRELCRDLTQRLDEAAQSAQGL